MAKKLFQLIAQEPELKSTAAKLQTESVHNFKGHDLFRGLDKSYQTAFDGAKQLQGDRKEVATTVLKRLRWQRPSVVALLDYELSRDATNAQASADLTVGDKVLAKAVPVTTLLSLESRLRELRTLYETIPTLDMTKQWRPVADDKDGMHFYGPVRTNSTEKKTRPVVLYEATKEHPAQVKEVTEDVVVGYFDTLYWSGEATPQLKANLLGRIDQLILAVKDARMRANDVVVTERKIGDAIFDFLHAE